MNRLQERRMALGLTQPQVSARLKETEPRADVGMVSRYEKGVCLPTADQLKALENVLGAPRTELYDAEDLDLLGALPTAESRSEASETETAPPTAPTGRFRKCYRISREFAASLPDDLLQVCGYSSWQSWHDAALKRLLGEYAARKRATKVEQPESEFLLRLDDDGNVGLFEADGGMWQQTAKASITAYFEDKLAQEVKDGKIVVMM